MKKIKFIAMLFTALTMCVCLNSCSDDPEPQWDENPAKTIAGTYVGNGALKYLDMLDVESWNGMRIEVTRSSNEYVTLSLKFANGETILSGNKAYNVVETSSGYILKDAEATDVIITISKSGEMHYYNPNISVSGESGYSITFDGKIEK